MAKRKVRANGEGSICQRKDKDGKPTGLWQGQYIDNIGKRRTLYGKTQQIIKDKLKEAIRQSDKKLRVDAAKITFAEWLNDWLETYSKPNVRPKTYSEYHFNINSHIIPAFPKVLLKDLDTDMLQKFFNAKAVGGRLDKVTDPVTGKKVQREGGLSLSVLSKMKKVIVCALNQAVENHCIEENPAKKVKLPKIHQPEIEVLSIADQKKLEAVALKDRNPLAFIIILALYTGMRVGELLGLKINDIDFDKKELHVKRAVLRVSFTNIGDGKNKVIVSEPKTEKGKRTIPLPDFILELLQKYITERNERVNLIGGYWYSGTTATEAENWIDEGYIFISSYGRLSDYSSIRQLFYRILDENGISRIKFHALRHTFATRAIESGFDIKSLSDILGHTDAKMTLNIYSHALTEQKRENMEKLATLFNSDSQEYAVF